MREKFSTFEEGFFCCHLESVERISAIQCYYCRELDYHCPMPLNLDGGDESNENDIDTGVFDPGFACMVNNLFKLEVLSWKKKSF